MKRPIAAAVLLAISTLSCTLTPRVANVAPAQCEQLASAKIENTVIASAERVTRGVFTSPGLRDSMTNLPTFCRVTGEIQPTSDSHIAFELWLPLENWNGKFVGVGNGGWAGIISYAELANHLRRGYATVSTNTGHVAEPGLDQARFAFGHPERLADFGWRSVHEMTVKGKAITTAFYGRAPRYAYFVGCSTGGKQGLTQAQRFPADYDGIVAVAPANNWVKLMAGDFAPSRSAAVDVAGRLPAPVLRILNEAALRTCDRLDGVADSLIENPAKCTFDPATIQCDAGAETSGSCLTAAQVRTARTMYDGARDPNGRMIFPGLARGGELAWGPLTNPNAPFAIPVSYYRWLVFGDPNWDWKAFDLGNAADYARHLDGERKFAPVLAAVDPNLRAFRSRGGKLIQTHGWNDQLISPQNSIDYYESVLALEGGGRAREAARRVVQEFHRLFMVPGMLHCGGGPGPNTYDALGALEAWVERGIAPESITATHLTNRVPDRTRPLCPYPKVARYNGSGDFNRAENFSCS